MKACIYNPYLDTLGGGERYTMSFAKVLLNQGYDVDIEWKDESIIKKLEDRFGIDLNGINVVENIKVGDGYDLCFWVSDGSIPLMHGRVNVIHFQVPFHNVKGRSLLNRMKLFRVGKIVCNSNFTKEVIDKEFGIKSIVIYPPVDTESFKPKHKENLILYVGRFSRILQSKGQEILISAFKNFYDGGHTDWKMILAGGMEVGAGEFLRELKNLSNGYPIEIIESPSFAKLKDLYGTSRIFWSAAGFGQDEKETPERMEHFGITAVEAMKSGAVPFLYDGGGHKEIVKDGVNGYLWKDINGLVERTAEIVNNKQFRSFEVSSKSTANQFSFTRFEKEVVSYILHNTF